MIDISERGKSILQEAHELTHGPRRADYGHPLDDYTRTAGMISSLLKHKLKEPLAPHEAAMIMICVKMSRQINAPKRDNMLDAAGYAWVVQECHDEATRRATPRATQAEEITCRKCGCALPHHYETCPLAGETHNPTAL